MPERQVVSSYRYGYNGQETDKEWRGGQAISFRFRVSDPRLGRFLSVDPLSPEYPWYTPYQFAGNMVIQASELEGLEPYRETYHDPNGNTLGTLSGKDLSNIKLIIQELLQLLMAIVILLSNRVYDNLTIKEKDITHLM